MDEQQLRSAVVAAAEERLANLEMQESNLLQQRNEVVVAMEAVTGNLREIQGRKAETLEWIAMIQDGKFVEAPDEPEEDEDG